MPDRTPRTPSYRRHKPTNQGVVTIAGKDFYLGRWNTAASRAEYDRIIAEWLQNGRRLPTPAGSDLSVNELALAFLKWADGYYRKNGIKTREVLNIKHALRPLRKLYGHTPARDFGPLALKAARQLMIDDGLCRNVCNRRTRIVIRAFKWGVENELVPSSVHHALRAVAGLRRGRSEARETKPVRPVPDAYVDEIRPHVSRQVWAMIELQRLAGMRPSEVATMRTCDLDTSGAVWTYTPASHKTEHHGRTRTIQFGPRAQEILGEWLRSDLTAPLFQPREAMAEFRASLRENRKSRVQPSQQNRRKRRPRKQAGVMYDTAGYRQAIDYGLRHANRERAAQGLPPIHWHPNQLRHNAATMLRKEFGLDVARAVLGHASTSMTEVYAEVDATAAANAMLRVG